MSHSYTPFSTSESAATMLADPSLQRYLPPHLVADLDNQEFAPRKLLESYVQLASARYTIGTYLPRRLIAHELEHLERSTKDNRAEPWLEWADGALLFADVSGSTALAERLTVLGREGTEIVTGVLNDFFDTIIAVADSYGGDLLAFGGDALLIFFASSAPAHTATAAALELLERLHGFERTVSSVGTFPLALHIGVERGRVALASAGQRDTLRYCALGSTVNGVAQAESYGGRGELVLGPNAWQEIAADATGVEVGPDFWRVTRLRPGSVPTDSASQHLLAANASSEEFATLLYQLNRLSPYLPAGLLPRIVAHPQRPLVEADLRPVTVLFAQVVGLGPLVESLDETVAAAALHAFLQPVQAAIERFGGVVNKLDLADEGDKLLAIFGAPVAYEDHAERAARAALAVQASLDEVNLSIARLLTSGEESAQPGDLTSRVPSPTSNIPPFLSVRIGLNTGTVFAGNVGTAERKEYTVMGDAVNVAARVMVKTSWNEVWCSDATATLIRERLACEDRGRVQVKGKAEPLPLFSVAGEGATTTSAASIVPLVGRQLELAALCNHLDAALAGAGRTVRVIGDAGIGKSRLMAALMERAFGRRATVLSVDCLSYAASIPYAPWGDLLRRLCDISASDTQTERTNKLVARLRALGADQEQWLPLLADLVRLEVAETSLTRALDPQLRQERIFELMEALVREQAIGNRRWIMADDGKGDNSLPPASSGLLLVFEDLHWADQISLDLWQRIAASIDDVPVLLLGAHRPGLSWGSGPQGDAADEIVLRELTPDDSETLVTSRLGDVRLPNSVRTQLVARAGGNPLFLEELMRALAVKLQLDEHKDSQSASSLQSSIDELPDSLNGLLLARIDQLDENSRTLLRVASVIGQRFPVGVLQAIQATDQRTLLQQLTQLDQQELTALERESPEQVHIFRHGLLQEVAYGSLLFSRRRELHRRIGEYLERRYADTVESYYGLLAHHYRLSDQHDKAVTYLMLAGRAACDEYANDDGIQYYQSALDLLLEPGTHDPRIWDVRGALGDVFSTVGRYEEGLAHYAAILASTPPPPPAVAGEAHRDRGSAQEKQGQYAPALDELRQAESICRHNLDDIPPLLLAEIYADMGMVLMRRGEYDEALNVCREGLNMMRRDQRSREDERIEARLHSQLGTIFGMRGNYAEARFHVSSSLAAQKEIDDLSGMVRSNNNIGYLWQLQSEYQRALDYYRIAEEFAGKINLRYAQGAIALNIAGALYYVGRYEEAEQQCMQALEICRSVNDQRNIGQIQEMLGLIAYCRGDYATSLDRYASALAIHQEAGNVYQQGTTLVHQAASHNALGRYATAIELAAQALAQAEELQAQQLKVEALNALAEGHLLNGEPDRAAAHAALATQLASELGSKFDQAVAERLQGEVAVTINVVAAETHLRQSIALFEEIKQRFELARSHASLARALVMCGNLSDARSYLQQAQDTFVAIGAKGELHRLTPLIERSTSDVPRIS